MFPTARYLHYCGNVGEEERYDVKLVSKGFELPLFLKEPHVAPTSMEDEHEDMLVVI